MNFWPFYSGGVASTGEEGPPCIAMRPYAALNALFLAFIFDSGFVHLVVSSLGSVRHLSSMSPLSGPINSSIQTCHFAGSEESPDGCLS